MTLAPDVVSPLRTVAILAAAVAAVAAVTAFWPRKFPALEPTPLANYVAAEEAFTRLTVTDTLEVMLNEGTLLLRRKALGLRVALVALTAAAIALGAGILLGSS